MLDLGGLVGVALGAKGLREAIERAPISGFFFKSSR